MFGDVVVIDAVSHGLNHTVENDASPLGRKFAEGAYYDIQVGKQPQGWARKKDLFFTESADPVRLAHALFAESHTDATVYHGLPLGMFKDGGSPLWVGKAMRDRWPGRVAALYGPIKPFQPGAIEEVDRLVEEDGVSGLKFYPIDFHDEQQRVFRMDDEKVAFPLFERARKHGLRSIAVHKALPQGPTPQEPYQVGDVQAAAAAFPDLTFEVVHGGYAFLEETALLLHHFRNVIVTLEATSTFLATAPLKFAHVIGTLLQVGGAERIVWATGAEVVHPHPPLEAFWDFQMPQELMDGYGYPQLTKETKRAILSGNIARVLGLDIAALQQASRGDEFSARTTLAEPWSAPVQSVHI